MILLARHGETDSNAEGRVQGWIDPPLNERGLEQARELAHEAAGLGLAALYTSQLLRARLTAEIVGREVGLEPRVDPRFAESRRGAWEGRLLAEIEREEPEAWAAWRRGGADFRFPGGGESFGEHAARVAAGVATVAEGPLPALIVCHGGSIRCAVATAAGGTFDDLQSIAVPNAALVRLPQLSVARNL